MKSPFLLAMTVLLTAAGAFLAGATWTKWTQRSSAASVATAATEPLANTVSERAPEAAPPPNQAAVKHIFQQAKPVQDLSRLLQLLRSGSKLAAQGQIATEVSRLEKAQVAGWLQQLDLLPSGDSVQETLRTALIERWAEVDLPGMLAEATKPQSGFFWGNQRANYYMVQETAFRLLAARNPQEAWEKASRSGMNAKRSVLMELALSNPEAGVKLLSEGKNMMDSWAAESFFQTWAGGSPGAAAAALDKIKNASMRGQALRSVATTWAQRDPAGALAWADGQTNVRERNNSLSEILSAQADTNPQEALTNLRARNLGGSQNYITQRIMSTWANRDFDAALNFATAQTKFSDQSSTLRGVVQALNGDEARMHQVLSLAQTLPTPLAREIYQSGVFSIVYNQPDQLQAWVNQIKQPSIKESVMKQALNNFRFYGVNQEVCSKMFDQLQPTSQSPDQAAQIASVWAYDDREQALAWAEKITNVESQKKAVASAIDSWADSNPLAAAGYVKGMPAGETRDEALSRLAQSWVSTDPKAAQAWANSLTGDEQSKVLGAMVNKAQSEDPESAPQAYAKFAASLSPEAAAKKENQTLAKNVASNLAKDDPQRAITWMEGLPGGGAREQAIGGIAESWISYDPGAASEWITQLPVGEGRDTAAGKLATTVARDDPTAAFVWATSIGDPAARRKSAESVLETWKNNGGKEAARTALEGANFTDQERVELLKKLE